MAARAAHPAIDTSDHWVRLEVPASQVALEGSTISAMSFSQYNGRATWDAAGKSAVTVTNTGGGTGTGGTGSGGGSTNPPPATVVSTNTLPGATSVDYINLALPQVG